MLQGFLQIFVQVFYCSYSTIQHFGLTQCCKNFYKYFGRFFIVHTVQYSILADKRPQTMLQGFLQIYLQVFYCSYSTITAFWLTRGLTQCCKDFYKCICRFFTVHTVQYSILADKRPQTMLQGFLQIFRQVFFCTFSPR